MDWPLVMALALCELPAVLLIAVAVWRAARSRRMQ